MITLSICEYGQINRSDLTPKALRTWQRFDEQHAKETGDTVFDWNYLHVVKAKNYVGVVQIDDLQIEILPKIDAQTTTVIENAPALNARQNFLYMLSLAGRLPLHERDLASQKLRRLPLWEAFIRAFAAKLLLELRRGQQHLYTYQENDLPCVRGRILIRQQLARGVTRRHRVYVGYDEFSNDTLMNQILRAACGRLLSLTRLTGSQQLLREALLELADVTDRAIRPIDFDEVTYDRSSERFRHLIDFCRLLYRGASPSAEIGCSKTFSMLFPMEILFEEFVGGCLKKFAAKLGYRRKLVHLQSKSNRRWLLHDVANQGKFRLKPDVFIADDEGRPWTILDTKWKRLLSDEVDTKNGVQQGDMYQLYAYATRYQSPNNILLFPHTAGVTPKRYLIEGLPHSQLRVEFLDLNYDLRLDPKRLIADFRRILYVE